MPRTKTDLGAPDYIHAGDGRTRLTPDWLPDRGVDLVPDFVLVGLETFECEGVVRSLLVFQHREMASVLRTFGLLDPETRRHPACEFVLIPGSSPNPGRWIENGGTDHALAMARETPGPMDESLARRVFTTVPGGIFVADGALPEPTGSLPRGLAEFPETERWVQPPVVEDSPQSSLAAEFPVFALNTRPPQLMARTPVVRLLCSSLQPSQVNTRARLHPATNISRSGVENWCRAWGMRLPTSREWRVALRGGADSRWRWFFGNDEALMSRYAWLHPPVWFMRGVLSDDAAAAAQEVLHPVAQLAPNAYGLYDMLGNADEMLAGRNRTEHAQGSYARSVAEQGELYPPPLGELLDSQGQPEASRPRPSPPFGALLGFRPVRDIDSRSLRKLAAAGLAEHLFFKLPQTG